MLLPGFHWSGRNTNGPLPTTSVSRLSPGVRASRSGSMKGTGAFGLPSTSSTSGNGSLRVSTNVRASFTSSDWVEAISRRPMASRGAQRLREATQSVAVTGPPSCQRKPSRSWKVQVRRSEELSKRSTICGRIAPLSSIANSVS